MAEQGGVRVDHSFGGARRTRRVDDGQRVCAVDIVFHRGQQCGVDRLGELVQALEIAWADRDLTQLRRCGREQRPFGVEIGVRHRLRESLAIVVGAKRRRAQQDLGVAVDQLLTHLAGRDEGRKRDHHRADPRRSQHPDHELGAVRVEESHVGALAGTERDQSAGKLCRAALGLGVADAFVVANKKRVF